MTDTSAAAVSADWQFSDVGTRKLTRVLFSYGLTNQLPDIVDNGRPAYTLTNFGRFSSHVEDAQDLLPRTLIGERIDESLLRLPGKPLHITEVAFIVTITPRGDVTLAIDAVVPENTTSTEVADLLAASCFRAAELTVGDVPILKWLRQRLDPDDRLIQQDLEFGRDIHQMVFPGETLLREIREADDGSESQLNPVIGQLVYRGTVSGALTVRTPETLNAPEHALVAHGRGVSVAAGWGPHVENTLALIAITLVSALGVVQRARRNAFTALSLNEQALLASAEDARNLVARLSARLNQLQLDLSFGVEAYIDNVLIPELLIGSFQSSLVETVGLSDGLTNTSRMLDRLHAIIQTRLSLLEAVAQEQDDRRTKVLSSVVAVGSLVALPPALLLAFFGVNATEVEEGVSMFDLSQYWPAYLLAWLPFVLLVVIGFLLTRRIRVASPRLRMNAELSKADRGTLNDLLPKWGTAAGPADLERGRQ